MKRKSKMLRRECLNFQSGASDAHNYSTNTLGIVDRAIDWYFWRISIFCTQHTYLTLIVPLLVAISLTAIGFSVSQLKFSEGDLWVSPTSSFAKLQDRYTNLYGPFYQVTSIVMVAKNEEDDLLDKKYLKELYLLETMVQEMRNNSLSEICLKPIPNGACMKTSVLYFFNYDINLIMSLSDDQIHSYASRRGGVKNEIGISLEASSVMGGITYDKDLYWRITKAKAFQVTYLFNNTEEHEETIREWDEQFIRDVEELASTFNYSKVTFSTGISFENELIAGLLSQAYLVPVGFVLMIIFVLVTLRKVLVGLFGIFLIIVAAGFGFGVCSFLGIGINPLTLQIVPVLVLSIGIDNVFILCKGLGSVADSQKSAMSEQKLLALCFRHTGHPITLSTTYLISVFSIGSVINVPVVQALCYQICAAMIASYFLQTTSFCCALVLDLRSQKKTCCQPKSQSNTEGAKKENKLPSLTGLLYKCQVASQRFPKLKMTGKYLTVAIFLGLSVGGYIAANRLDSGIEVETLLPKSSYLRDYYHYSSKYFSQTGFPFFVIMEDLEYEKHDVQDKMLAIKTALESHKDLVSGKINCWYNDMISWIVFLDKHRDEYNNNNRRIPPEKFYAWLNEFLSEEGAPHSINLVFNEEGKLKASRLLGTFVSMPTTSSLLKGAKDGIRILEEADRNQTHSDQALDPFLFSPYFPLVAQFDNLKRETTIVFALSAVCAFVICTIFFANVVIGFLILCVLIIVTGDLFLVQYIFDIKMNAISLLISLSAIAISVEYISHIGRTYLIQLSQETKGLVTKTMLFVGPMITLSVLSSLIGLGLMLFMKFPMIQKYFGIMWVSVILIAALHGLVFLPVLLSCLPLDRFLKPKPESHSTENIELRNCT